jgi:E1-E2 ATPase
VTKSWEDSTLNRIVQLTEEGQFNKPKLQRWLDEFGEHYSRVVVALSLVVALFGPFLFKWPFIGNSGNNKALSFFDKAFMVNTMVPGIFMLLENIISIFFSSFVLYFARSCQGIDLSWFRANGGSFSLCTSSSPSGICYCN